MKPCRWCQAVQVADRATYCGRKCRQAAFRLRRRAAPGYGELTPGVVPGLRFAYADPPYPGKSRKFYADQPSYAGEVDHRALIERLQSGGYAGWALSTSSAALRAILPMVPERHRVCGWGKPLKVPAATYGPHSTWEALIVVGGRPCRPGVRDWLEAQPARYWGTLPGRKPLAFCAWLFDLLGMVPGDFLDDLFPGTGMVGRAWGEMSVRIPQQPLPGLNRVSLLEQATAGVFLEDPATVAQVPADDGRSSTSDEEKGEVDAG